MSLTSHVGSSLRNIEGVKGLSSVDSSETYVSGRSLRSTLYSQIRVLNSSKFTEDIPRFRTSKGFKSPVSLSHQPPHQAAVGGLNFQVIFLNAMVLVITFQSNSER